MSLINPLTTSGAVKRPNGETAEDMFQNAEVLLQWGALTVNQVYNLQQSIRNFRFVYFLFSCMPSGSHTNNSLLPTWAIPTGGSTGNAIMLNNIITSSMFANAQVGFPSETTFAMSYLENSNTDVSLKKFFVRIYGIK